MRAEFFMSALLLTTCAGGLIAQDGKGIVSSELAIAKGSSVKSETLPAISVVDEWLSLSNRTVSLIARVRGVKADAVLIKASYAPKIGPYAIDLANSTNFFAEAEALSRELGTRFKVVVDAASDDGTVNTNRTFQNGVMRQMILKVEGTPMPPAHRKLYVRPQSSGRLQPPRAVRLVQ